MCRGFFNFNISLTLVGNQTIIGTSRSVRAGIILYRIWVLLWVRILAFCVFDDPHENLTCVGPQQQTEKEVGSRRKEERKQNGKRKK